MTRAERSAQAVFQGKVFSVIRHSVVEPGGVRVIRDVVYHHGSAVILPRFSDGRIVLVRQFRMAVGRSLWELPAGSMDRGETALQTARRELAEETGYRSQRWRKLAEFYPSPGFLDEKLNLFLAQDISPGTARPEQDERIQVQSFRFPELLAMIRAGKIRDGKTLVGLLYWRCFGSEVAKKIRSSARR